MRRMLGALALTVGLVLGLAGCKDVPDTATITKVQYTANGPKGEQWLLLLKNDDGTAGQDGPYFTKGGIGRCAAGKRWPSCLKH